MHWSLRLAVGVSCGKALGKLASIRDGLLASVKQALRASQSASVWKSVKVKFVRVANGAS
jgi:hypothetical protein